MPKHLFDANTVAARFAANILSASAAERWSAVTWYPDARAYAEHLRTIRPEWSMEVAASIISAYSPRTRWDTNKFKAFTHAEYARPRGLSAHYRTALLAEQMGFNALRGLKTNAFARAIAGDPNAVVIDTWMMKAAGLTAKAPTRRQYLMMVDIVRDLAPKYGLFPADAQALIWIVQRGSAE